MNDASKAGQAKRGFSEEERSSMRARAAELRSEARAGKGAKKAAADEAAVREKIADMPSPDRALAERLHAIVLDAAPELLPRLWYGQPDYTKDGKVLCFFRSGQGDKERYSTFGFSTAANLDDETGIWATSFALTELSEAGEQMIAELVERAAR